MSKKQETSLGMASKLAKQIYDLSQQENKIKKEKEELKGTLAALCNSVYDEQFKDGKWSLPKLGLQIHLALNKHKVIDTRSGDSLNPNQRQAVALSLADKYCVVDINAVEIQASLEHDKELKKILSNHHLQVIQETRYDVKKMK